jgi:succinyl-CoA synthetase alpha subunit
MKPTLFTAKNVIVQGITGTHGRFQTKAMLNAGTTVVAGTTPGKAGQSVEGVPVYNSIIDIQKDHSADTTIIFVPAPFAKSAITEAITAEIPLIVCITEGIPIHDMIEIRKLLKNSHSVLIGPNCPGVIVPSINKLGIIPASMSLAGHAAIVSRSGTLTYEAMAGLTGRGIGQRYVIGIGGDPVRGINFVECLELFESDPQVDQIILIGEIGGIDEQLAANYIKKSVTKPVFAYIAGSTAPEGIQLGHAGAILGSNDESAEAKSIALEKAGAHAASSITSLIELVANGDSRLAGE